MIKHLTNTLLIAIVWLFVNQFAIAQTPSKPEIVKNIVPQGALTAVGDLLFFTADDGIHGRELWKSDGTEQGTVLVKDIAQGENSSSPLNMIAFKRTLLFFANDGISGAELWKSDGTELGTVLIKDITPENVNSNNFRQYGKLSNSVYFAANDGINGEELWRTDGTKNGTTLVKNINVGGDSSFPSDFITVGDILFFTATSADGKELWKSDGTSTGTVMVRDIFPGPDDSGARPRFSFKGLLYFVATTDGRRFQFWKTDGSEDGTKLIQNDFPDEAPLNNRVAVLDEYFLYSSGPELWRSDGTKQGTELVKLIGSEDPDPRRFTSIFYGTVVGGKVFFVSRPVSLDDPGITSDASLWITDGTTRGTVLLKDNFRKSIPLQGERFGTDISWLTEVNGTLFFGADDRRYGSEVWKSDGSISGTKLLKDIIPGEQGSRPFYLEKVGNTLFFYAFNATANGRRSAARILWKVEVSENDCVYSVIPIRRAKDGKMKVVTTCL